MQGRGDRSVSSVHDDPARNGTRFGVAVVTVDMEVGDCVVEAPVRHGPVPMPRRMRLHGLEEIQGAYLEQRGLAGSDPVAFDMANALKFAGQRIRQKQEGNRK